MKALRTSVWTNRGVGKDWSCEPLRELEEAMKLASQRQRQRTLDRAGLSRPASGCSGMPPGIILVANKRLGAPQPQKHASAVG